MCGYSSSDSSLLPADVFPVSFFWSPSTVVSGQNENAGHFSHPTAKATGQIVMWFTPFNDELECTPVKAIIQKLQLCLVESELGWG